MNVDLILKIVYAISAFGMAICCLAILILSRSKDE